MISSILLCNYNIRGLPDVYRDCIKFLIFKIFTLSLSEGASNKESKFALDSSRIIGVLYNLHVLLVFQRYHLYFRTAPERYSVELSRYLAK